MHLFVCRVHLLAGIVSCSAELSTKKLYNLEVVLCSLHSSASLNNRSCGTHVDTYKSSCWNL